MQSKPDGSETELDDWTFMTPQQRWLEYLKLWDFYIAMGGSTDPEPDPQSPFYCEEMHYATGPLAHWQPTRKEMYEAIRSGRWKG